MRTAASTGRSTKTRGLIIEKIANALALAPGLATAAPMTAKGTTSSTVAAAAWTDRPTTATTRDGDAATTMDPTNRPAAAALTVRRVPNRVASTAARKITSNEAMLGTSRRGAAAPWLAENETSMGLTR